MGSEQLKILARHGGGPRPGYRWHILNLDVAYREAMKFLDGEEYEHLAEQFREVASSDDPTRSLTVSLDAIEDFHELRDKGGPLGPKNVRVYYLIDKARRAIVIVGAELKKNDGPMLPVVKLRIRRRVRAYFRGEYGIPTINKPSSARSSPGGEVGS